MVLLLFKILHHENKKISDRLAESTMFANNIHDKKNLHPEYSYNYNTRIRKQMTHFKDGCKI